MAVKKFDKVFYRAAATPITTIAYSGSTPAGWTALPTGVLVSESKADADKAVTTPVQDGTEYIGSDKASVELTLIAFAAADLATLRTAFINVLVDILLLDSDNKSPAYVIWATRAYPKISSEEEPKITISCSKEKSISATTAPLTLITVT